MPKQSVSSTAVSMSLTGDELPPVFDGETAKELVREALAAEGLSIWPEMEIELFTGSTGVLLIARPQKGRPECFAFDDFESLLTAAGALDAKLSSSLLHYEERWLLSLRCTADCAHPALYEFGEPIEDFSESMEVFFAEHGEIIMPKDAVRLLKESFKDRSRD